MSVGMTNSIGWWRFDAYDVVGDTHIAPQPGAKIHYYNPIRESEAFWSGKTRKDNALPAYVALANVDLEDPWAIAEWCSEYGLLGILLHRTLSVGFWPRWSKRPPAAILLDDEESQLPDLPDRQATATQSIYQYQRGDYSGTRQFDAICDLQSGEHAGEPIHEDSLSRVSKSLAASDRYAFQQPHALITDPYTEKPHQVGIANGYAQFFPYTPGVTTWVGGQHEAARDLEREQYPIPFEEEFFTKYGEPISVFKQYAREIRNRIEFWRLVQDVKTEEELRSLVSENGWTNRKGHMWNGFLATLRTTSPTVRFRDSGQGLEWAIGWEVGSLYGMMHLMIMQDLIGKKSRIEKCNHESCARLFVTDHSLQRYCSSRCQKAAQTARYRRSLRIKALYGDGQSIETIAEKVDSDPDTVARLLNKKVNDR